MRNIDKTGLPGKLKAWIYQHGLLPRISWPLMLYEITLSTVEKLERTINRHLRKWLGVPPSFTTVGLYSRTAKLQLPLTSIVEEFKVCKTRLVMTLKESKDDKVRTAGVQVRTGRQWSASKAVSEAESRLRHKDIIGTVAVGRQGLGTSKSCYWKNANTKERRSLVQREVKSREEENRQAKTVELGCQGAWSRWDLEQRSLTWWKLSETPDSPLCGNRGTLHRVLSGCNIALTPGRYTWRHNQVLRELAEVIEKQRRDAKQTKNKPIKIQFVKEGELGQKSKQNTSGMLNQAKDWQLEVDLGKKLQFPDIVPTNLRPNMVLWSSGSKKVMIIELTVHWEERCGEANERKRAKYDELLAECRDKGWQTWNFPVEVGCRGFPAQSVWRLFSAVGVTGRQRRTAIQKLCQAAEKASCWIWMKRDSSSWKPTTNAQ
ncbi:uncharacterized protein LOC134716731 [Mytilus trossulus]|uniref:uncharacterized protein LOC134716731 n=1 Tax=Mytilus trossulus TaxID=6551 RepID=UPI00300583D5